jgi:hypothetical protein
MQKKKKLLDEEWKTAKKVAVKISLGILTPSQREEVGRAKNST